MDVSIRVLSPVISIQAQQLLTDVALASYIHRLGDAVAVDLVTQHVPSPDTHNTLCQLNQSFFRVSDRQLSQYEIYNYYHLDLFYNDYLCPLLEQLLDRNDSPLARKIQQCFDHVKDLAIEARAASQRTGGDVHPEGYRFWDESKRVVEFLREVIDGISITRKGQLVLARLQHLLDQR